MLHSFTKRYTDESTENEFIFSFICDLCDYTWQSVPLSFSYGKHKSLWKKIFTKSSSLWKEEHKDAFERANREGMFHFNRCTICKSWVCDEHFLVEENICFCCSIISKPSKSLEVDKK